MPFHSEQGDSHDPYYDNYARSVTLSDTGVSSAATRQYQLTIYPNDDFFALYRTSIRTIASAGAVAIVALTSLIFIIYDFAVRNIVRLSSVKSIQFYSYA